MYTARVSRIPSREYLGIKEKEEKKPSKKHKKKEIHAFQMSALSERCNQFCTSVCPGLCTPGWQRLFETAGGLTSICMLNRGPLNSYSGIAYQTTLGPPIYLRRPPPPKKHSSENPNPGSNPRLPLLRKNGPTLSRSAPSQFLLFPPAVSQKLKRVSEPCGQTKIPSSTSHLATTPQPTGKMKYIHSEETLEIPEGGTIYPLRHFSQA